MSEQGKGKSAKEILKRIDYFGSLSLMLAVRFHIHVISLIFNLILVHIGWRSPHVSQCPLQR